MTLHASSSETILHSGVLFKRGYGSTPLIGRKSWKPRHFELTRTTLRYFTFENGTLRDTVDLTKCHADALEIMPADVRKTGKSASSIWRLALNVPCGRRVLMAAPTEREMNAWIKHLGGALQDLHAKPTMDLLENQRVVGDDDDGDEGEEMKTEEDDKQDEDLANHRHVAASWKKTTTNFQNFVAQPRRSMIFRRHSLESQRCSFGLSGFRHSTGQIDDRGLAVELEELRQTASVSSGSDGSAGHGHGAGAVDSGGSSGSDGDDDEMTEQEEDELLRALRAFSIVHSENNDVDARSVDESAEPDNQRDLGEEVDDDKATPRSVSARVSPIFHYCKQESSSAAASATVYQNNVEAESDCTDPHDGAIANDGDAAAADDRLCNDSVMGKMRRFSTGSMVVLNERRGTLVERNDENPREEPLTQELLGGLVRRPERETSMSHAPAGVSPSSPLAGSKVVEETDVSDRSNSASDSIRFSSVEQMSTASRDSLASVNGPRVSTETNDQSRHQDTAGEQNHRDKWFMRLKSKWRSRRDEVAVNNTTTDSTPLRSQCSAEATAQLGGAAVAVDGGADDSDLMEPPVDDDVQGTIHNEVAAVLSDMVANVALMSEELCEQLLISSPSPVTEGVQASLVPVETTVARGIWQDGHGPRLKKRHFLWRWSAKLRRNRARRSRRHSTSGEETIPGTASSGAPHTTPPERVNESEPFVSDPKSDDPVEEARHFGATLRRATTSVHGLIELQEMRGGTFGEGDAPQGEESGGEEEMIVVVVRRRRRHSVGAHVGPVDSQASRAVQERTNYRVFVDVGEAQSRPEETPCSLALSSKQPSDHRVVFSPSVPAPIMPPRVCAV